MNLKEYKQEMARMLEGKTDDWDTVCMRSYAIMYKEVSRVKKLESEKVKKIDLTDKQKEFIIQKTVEERNALNVLTYAFNIKYPKKQLKQVEMKALCEEIGIKEMKRQKAEERKKKKEARKKAKEEGVEKIINFGGDE